MTTQHDGLPIPGYRPQSDAALARVRTLKQAEERILRMFDALKAFPPDSGIDHRWLSIATTHIEQGFMAANRAVFRPSRIDLPEDEG